MFARIRIFLSVFGSLGILAACSAGPSANLATPLPSTTTPDIPSATPELAGTQTVDSFDCQQLQEIPPEECQALISLYKSTDGDNWQDNAGWLVTATPCTWQGVICQAGHVVELQLFYNELTSSLPPEIGNFTQLKSLYLDSNQLNGPVPPEIGNLITLETLRLGGNQFSSLPAGLANLKGLIVLEVWGNQLSGEIPAELGQLLNLQILSLNSNQFTGEIPAELGNLVNLTHLYLSHNQLNGPIPATLGNLANLNELDISFNQLIGPIPIELGKLTSLHRLDLSYNQLTGIVPAALTRAPISNLGLWGNLLDGTVLASEGTSTTIEYQGVKFEFNSTLGESVWPEIGAVLPLTDAGPVWGTSPEHLRFTFANYSKPDSFQGGGIGVSGQPQILIYPTQSFRNMSQMAGERIDGLQALLAARPSAPENDIPLLPLINAAQVFHTQVKYLDFQNGIGIRFITHYSQAVNPIGNENIFYTFQGLTNDGAYYVAAYFPISAAGLSDKAVIEDPETFGARYQDYLTETVSHLNSLSSYEFEPNLDLLDSVIQSLAVSPP